jgi:hypothetical protein
MDEIGQGLKFTSATFWTSQHQKSGRLVDVRAQLLFCRGLRQTEKVNFGTDPYLSRPSNTLTTSDALFACQMPQHQEFGWTVDGEGPLLTHQGSDGLNIWSLGGWWTDKND